MNKLLATLAATALLVPALLSQPAMAENSQQNKMAACNKDAKKAMNAKPS